MNSIPIFFTFDNNYVVPAAVAFFSLLDRSKEGVFYDMHVLHSDISEENQTLLCDIVEQTGKGKLTFAHTKGFLADEWNSGNWENHQQGTQFTLETIYPCFASQFFPQYDRILYSDVDVVFMDDISELFERDITNVYVEGVMSAFIKTDAKEFTHLKPEHYEGLKDSYIAGGIWVLNLAKIRQDKLEQKILDVVRDNTIIKRWPDQDIMNIACMGHIGFLPLNYISYPYLLERMNQPGFESHYSREELYDSLMNPKVLHYAGDKPWKVVECQTTETWFDSFHYLRLKETFPTFCAKPQDQWKKKARKYRKAFLAALLCALLLGLLLLLTLLLG